MRSLKDRYELGNVLGEGGMGVVYRAIDRQMGREVAVKTIRDLSDSSALGPFHREAAVLSSLNHPNIVDVYDIGEFNDNGKKTPYFVMPLLPGAPLSALMASQAQRLTPERIVEIMLQALRGLQAAHEKGLVHRDLKPSNIFVLDDDSVKIIDFGISHFVGSQSTVVLKGTLYYMAPEQLDMQTSTALSDIFSIGVMCYETLTRKRPFIGATNEELAQAIRTAIPLPASELNPAVSSLLSQVIHAAMAKSPWHRFSTAREFAESLQKAVRNQPIERFDQAKVEARLRKSRAALADSEYELAGEILAGLESEGYIHPEIRTLRKQIDQATRSRAVRQLLDSAERRLKDEEYQLALEKLHQVLHIDPHHSDALKLKSNVEAKRNSEQVDNWLRLASDHLDNHSFTHARQALQKVMEIKPGDTRAVHLLENIDRNEQKYLANIREKEDRYQSALECWRQGEVTSALSQVEILIALDREYPEQSDAEKSAAYQDLYNTVRSEHESLKNSYDEAKRCLTDGNFADGLAVCQKLLATYPNHALFESLKLDLVEAQRQALSAFIARIDRDVQGELDLDRKVSILEAALEKQPNEPHFEEALKAVTARRQQISAIVARARNLEDRGQYVDARNQWEMLQTIYHLYPGLELEIERVKRRNELQASANRKTRILEQADVALKSTDFSSALRIITAAQSEYRGDAELASMEKLARDGVERQLKAEELVVEGRRLLNEGSFDDALSRLEAADTVSSGSPSSRAALLEALLSRASTLIVSEPENAEALVQRALMLDGTNSQAKNIRLSIADQKRELIIKLALSGARQFQADENLEAATAEVTQALKAYPGDARLIQLRDTLQQVHHASEPANDAPALSSIEPQVTEQFRATKLLQSAGVSFTSAPKAPDALAVPKRSPGLGTFLPGGLSKLRKSSSLSASFALGIILALAGILAMRSHNNEPKRYVAVADKAALPFQKIVFTTNVARANWTLDDQKMDSFTQTIKAGTHTVRGHQDGYLPFSKTFTVSSKQPSPLTVDLELIAAPLEPDAISNLKNDQVVSNNAERQNGTVVVHSNVPNSTIFVNGRKSKLPANNETTLLTLEPKRYRIKVARADYQESPEQSVDLRKGQTRSLNFQLTPIVRPGSLALSKFPAATKVAMDGNDLGATDDDGHFAKEIPPGIYTFAFHKDGYDDGVVKKEIKSNTTTVIGSEILVSQPGKVTFKASPSNTRISFQLQGVAPVMQATNGQTIPLRPGSYDVQFEAEHHHAKKQKIVLQRGESSILEVKLTPETPPPSIESMCQNPSQWRNDNGWWQHNTGEPGWFTRNSGDFVVAFLQQPSKALFNIKARRIEWIVDNQPNGSSITYVLNDRFLQRLIKTGSTTSTTKVPHNFPDNHSFTVRLHMSSEKIVVQRADGSKLDEYKRPSPEKPLGKFGVRGVVSAKILDAR